MAFESDNQTINDLELFGKDRNRTYIFDLFNTCKTGGGRKLLNEILRTPLNDLKKLNERVEAIRLCCDINLEFKINSGQFDYIEHYLRLNIAPLKNNFLDAYLQNISYKLNPYNDYFTIISGVQHLIYLFSHLQIKLKELEDIVFPEILTARIEQIKGLIENPELKKHITRKQKITPALLNKLDNIFRKRFRNEIRKTVETIYLLDFFISVAHTAKNKNFSFPQYLPDEEPRIEITGLFHPLVENAVPYNFYTGSTNNMCFLTGPNMAGKSTFLKSLGLSVYLAHLGFPVPAKEYKTTVFNGIITTINLSDNIGKGYSHFYSEAKRVKETALKIKAEGKVFVIFDELFRGTNVKDAFDASLLIIRSFAKIKNSFFCISTHISEIAEEIKHLDNILYRHFNSELKDEMPIYNYKISEGVCYDRLGLQIVKNEKIIEILTHIASYFSKK